MAENDFRDIAHPLNQFTRDMIREAVLDAYDRELRAEMNKNEEMAEKIRLGQASQLDIVASHDAIRGMIVDLYM